MIRRRSMLRAQSSGFTLIELAVVVFVVAIILGSILVPLSTQVEQGQLADAQRRIQEIHEALIGYALAQPQAALPCPDLTEALGGYTPNDGIEDIDPTSGLCATPEGNVPWATLGIPMSDPWGNRFRYRVTVGMAQRSPATPFGLSSPNGDLEVRCLAATEAALPTCNPGQPITATAGSANAAVAVIVSHGPNGWGAISSHSNTINLPPGCMDVSSCLTGISGNERENANGDAFFISRELSSQSSPVGEFDDIVMWLSPHTLKHRMVAAGKLP